MQISYGFHPSYEIGGHIYILGMSLSPCSAYLTLAVLGTPMIKAGVQCLAMVASLALHASPLWLKSSELSVECQAIIASGFHNSHNNPMGLIIATSPRKLDGIAQRLSKYIWLFSE